jgi:hypothetical protein
MAGMTYCRSLKTRKRFQTIFVFSIFCQVLPRLASAQAPVEPPPAAPEVAPAPSPVAAPAPLPPAPLPPPTAAPPKASPPPPYSVPWQLRAAANVNVLRSDTSIAVYDGGTTVASMLFGALKLTRGLGAFFRLAVVGDGGNAAVGNAAVGNPSFGGSYLFLLPKNLRLHVMAGMTVPINPPSDTLNNLARLGRNARAGMDNAMFAVNDVVWFTGFDLAWVAHKWTIQVEGTVFLIVRQQSLQDAFKANFTTGLHVGYFLIPQLSLGAELRYQRWLSTPVAVAADKTGTSRDQLSVAIGPRGHFKLPGKRWIRPGISYQYAIDDPMAAKHYHIVQLDIPVVF